MAKLEVSNRSELARISVNLQTRVYLTEARHEGAWKWDGADRSASIALDPDQAVYVAPVSDPSGAKGAWVRQIEDGRLNIEWGGAVADSLGFTGPMADRTHKTDNGPVIERMLSLASELGLTCYIPTIDDPDRFFSSRTTIFFPRKGDLEVDGKLVNAFGAEDHQNAMLFQPGNFHPAFTDRARLAVYSCGSPSEGDQTIALDNANAVSKFRVGDQIGVVSNASSAVAGYRSSCYHHLATVTGISGRTIEFDRPLSFGDMPSSAFNVSKTPARTINGQPRGLFFWTGRLFGTGHLQSERHSLWSDSALVDCDVGLGLNTHARRTVAYGNMCQNTRFHGFTAKCSQSFTELSQQPVDTIIENFTAIYEPTLSTKAAVTLEANIGGDHARRCIMRNGRLSARGAPPNGRPMIHIGHAQNCHVHDMVLEFDVRGTNAELLSISSSVPASSDFPYTNNVISRISASGVSSGYFVSLNGNNQLLYTDNRIVDVMVDAKLTGSNGYSAYISNCPGGGNALRNIDFGGQGILRIANCMGRQIATNLRNMGGEPIVTTRKQGNTRSRSHEISGIEWSAPTGAPSS